MMRGLPYHIYLHVIALCVKSIKSDAIFDDKLSTLLRKAVFSVLLDGAVGSLARDKGNAEWKGKAQEVRWNVSYEALAHALTLTACSGELVSTILEALTAQSTLLEHKHVERLGNVLFSEAFLPYLKSSLPENDAGAGCQLILEIGGKWPALGVRLSTFLGKNATKNLTVSNVFKLITWLKGAPFQPVTSKHLSCTQRDCLLAMSALAPRLSPKPHDDNNHNDDGLGEIRVVLAKEAFKHVEKLPGPALKLLSNLSRASLIELSEAEWISVVKMALNLLNAPNNLLNGPAEEGDDEDEGESSWSHACVTALTLLRTTFLSPTNLVKRPASRIDFLGRLFWEGNTHLPFWRLASLSSSNQDMLT